MTDKLSRAKIEVVRFVQAFFAAAAIIAPSVGDSQGVVMDFVAAAFALALVVLELVKRQNTTPISDPKDEHGQALIPVH